MVIPNLHEETRMKRKPITEVKASAVSLLWALRDTNGQSIPEPVLRAAVDVMKALGVWEPTYIKVGSASMWVARTPGAEFEPMETAAT